MTYAVLAILVLWGALLPARAQPQLAEVTSWTEPTYLGRSISANMSIQNLASTFAKLSQVQLEFDWNQTFTGPLKILAPGESYEWKFPNCPVPEHTWLGNHTFVFSFNLSWTGAAGNWSLETKRSVPTHFSVEPPQQPGPGPLENLDAFLRSPLGISAFLLTMALVVVVAVTIEAPSPRRKTLQRVSSLILSGIGFAILWYFSGKELDSWRLAVGTWILQLLWILSIALVSVAFVHLHKRLWSESFERAVDTANDLSLGAIGLSCFMLSFTFCTLEFLLPFREVLVTFLPMLQPASPLIPVSFTASAFLTTYNGAILVIVLPGPAILLGLRTMRRWNPQTGRTTLEILQVMFYASVLLALYSWASGGTLSGELLENYRTSLVLFVLPGSLIVPLAICLLMAMGNRIIGKTDG